MKFRHNAEHLFLRLGKIFINMKNLISSFSIINLKKNLSKTSKVNGVIVDEKLIHYRRDLDSLG